MANKDNNSDTDFVNVIQQHKNNSSSLSFLHQQNMDSSPTKTGKNETFFFHFPYIYSSFLNIDVCAPVFRQNVKVDFYRTRCPVT